MGTTTSYGPDTANRHITTWFRHTFVVTNAIYCQRSLVRLLRDDGVAIHLNGVEIYRDNLPTGPISPATLAVQGVEEGAAYHTFDLMTPFVEGTNVLAVEVHQWDAASTDLLFDLELSCPLSRSPYLQMGAPSSIVVCWRTAEPTASWVRYGTASNELTNATGSPALTQEHHVVLTGLSPDTRYTYDVGTPDQVLASGPGLSFRTAPVQGRPTRILVTSDMQYRNPWILPAIERFTLGRPPDLWLAPGDVGGDGDEQRQERFFNNYAPLLQQTVIWPCMGNHDAWLAPLFLEAFDLPTQAEAGGVPSGTEHYYSFNYGNIHCVVLNSNPELEDRSTNGPMYAWLTRDLAANNADWLIAFWHHPPYTKGTYDSDVGEDFITMRENFLPLLEAQGVDLVLFGHNHTYERSYLLDSHYGLSTTLDRHTMIKNGGDGRRDGSGPYCKPSLGPNPHQGAVYVKVTSAYTYPTNDIHPAMFSTQVATGCLVLDIEGPVLEATFLKNDGTVGDYFTILKGVRSVPPRITDLQMSDGRAILTWNAVPDRYYRVDRSLTLPPLWEPASPWVWSETQAMRWTEPIPMAQPVGAIYRLMLSEE